MVRFCKTGMKIIMVIIMLFLTVISLVETQRSGRAEWNELTHGYAIYKNIDNIFIHICAIVLLLLFMVLIQRRTVKEGRIVGFVAKHIRILQGIIAIFSGIISLLILLDGTRTPISDQLQIHYAAQLLNEGNYINFSKGGYLNMYPQQLGYVMYMQIIYRLFGSPDFQNVQIINCFFIAGGIFAASTFLNDLTEETVPRIIGSILLAFLIPVQVMGSWLYGDVMYYMFLFIFLHHFLMTFRHKRKHNIILAILSATVCVVFRKHALIMLTAILLVCVVSAIEKKKWSILLYGFLCFLIPMSAVWGIEKYYSEVSGYEIDGGIPSIAWVTMGTIEDYSSPGWFSNYNVPLYFSTNFDRELTQELALQRLGQQIDNFIDNPIYALSFYKRKICTQWNDPFYNTEGLIPVDSGETLQGISLFLMEHQDGVLVFLSALQSIIYAGTLAYICLVSYKKEFSATLPEMIILGGFLFSIIWEAKSRYVLNNYLIMFPLAAVGWYQLLLKLQALRARKLLDK